MKIGVCCYCAPPTGDANPMGWTQSRNATIPPHSKGTTSGSSTRICKTSGNLPSENGELAKETNSGAFISMRAPILPRKLPFCILVGTLRQYYKPHSSSSSSSCQECPPRNNQCQCNQSRMIIWYTLPLALTRQTFSTSSDRVHCWGHKWRIRSSDLMHIPSSNCCKMHIPHPWNHPHNLPCHKPAGVWCWPATPLCW